jgi:hypothetical protein
MLEWRTDEELVVGPDNLDIAAAYGALVRSVLKGRYRDE